MSDQKNENKEFIPLSVPSITGNEWKNIKECLDTNWVSSVGSYVNDFERAVSEYTGAEYAVAMVNGTAAIHISLILAGVERGDEVIMPALTFVSPANCVKYVGAIPLFMDVESEFFQIDTVKLRSFLEKNCEFKVDGRVYNKFTGRKISAIIPVDLLGHPANLEEINILAEQYNLKVIEDATESLGAEYKGKKLGTFSDISCFSFNGNKIITTGGGGMLVTDNHEYAEKARYLSQQAKDDPVEYYHKEIGYNYRLTNIQAAMGCAQMEQLDSFIEKKRFIADRYSSNLSDVPGITCPGEAGHVKSTFWLYTIQVDKGEFGLSARELMKLLQSKKIQTRPLWYPLNSLPYFKDSFAFDLENVENIHRDSLSIPCSVDITLEQLQRVINEIKEAQIGK
jgi:perosamine synthetase